MDEKEAMDNREAIAREAFLIYLTKQSEDSLDLKVEPEKYADMFFKLSSFVETGNS